jgi:ribosome assembly protein 1
MAPLKTTNAPRGTIRGASQQNYVTFTIRAVPLPQDLIQFILDNVHTLKALQQGRKDQPVGDGEQEYDVGGTMLRRPEVKPEQFWEALREKCEAVGGEWAEVVDRIWAFGPQRVGGCILVDKRKTGTHQS